MASSGDDGATTRPKVKNTVSGLVSGQVLQAGAVHGDVHIHLGAAAVQSAMGAAAELQTALTAPVDVGRKTALQQLLEVLEAVHRDYLVMFESILDRVPDAWALGTPGFTEDVRVVVALLRQLRLVYEPVRVRVHTMAEACDRAALSEQERTFVSAVLAYFPTGELRVDEPDHPWYTSGTAVLDHLYRALEGELGQELRGLVKATMASHRQRWRQVCRGYAQLQLGTELGG